MRAFIRDAPFGLFLPIVLLPLGLAAAAAFAGWRARRQAALLTKTVTEPIGMAADGYREFQGELVAVDGESLAAPLTGTPCCWYEARVEKWTRSTPSSRQFYWETVRSVTSSAPVLMRDASGICTVHVYGAEVTPADQSQWTGATLEPEDRNPPRNGTAAAPSGTLQIGSQRPSVYRYTEARLYAGDPLLVLGRFTNRRFEAPDDDDRPAEEDEAEDDETSTTDAWTTVDRERAAALTARAAALTPLEIGIGGRDEPLVISTSSEGTHVAAAEMGSQAAFTLAVVPLGIAALILFVRFG